MLIDQLRHFNIVNERVCLVSFNYDLLLDHAIFPSGANAQHPDTFLIDDPMFSLFKPHGSVDWGRAVSHKFGQPIQVPEDIIQQGHLDGLSDEYVRVDASDIQQPSKFNAPIVPAIAIPVQTKTEDTFEWPAKHRMLFERLLSVTKRILIIGWQGKEAHFLKLLRERLPRGASTEITHLQVVARNSSEASDIAKQFVADIGREVKRLHTATQGFTQFVRQEQIRFFFIY